MQRRRGPPRARPWSASSSRHRHPQVPFLSASSMLRARSRGPGRVRAGSSPGSARRREGARQADLVADLLGHRNASGARATRVAASPLLIAVCAAPQRWRATATIYHRAREPARTNARPPACCQCRSQNSVSAVPGGGRTRARRRRRPSPWPRGSCRARGPTREVGATLGERDRRSEPSARSRRRPSGGPVPPGASTASRGVEPRRADGLEEPSRSSPVLDEHEDLSTADSTVPARRSDNGSRRRPYSPPSRVNPRANAEPAERRPLLRLQQNVAAPTDSSNVC